MSEPVFVEVFDNIDRQWRVVASGDLMVRVRLGDATVTSSRLRTRNDSGVRIAVEPGGRTTALRINDMAANPVAIHMVVNSDPGAW